MEKSSIEMIKKMEGSLERLANAWYDVRNCWEDGEVMEVMARMCDIYPFDRSFDEMTDEVDTWAYLSANELRKVSVIEEQWNKIENSEINISDIEIIIDALHERFHHIHILNHSGFFHIRFLGNSFFASLFYYFPIITIKFRYKPHRIFTG